MNNGLKIGVLALQGSVEEHTCKLNELGVDAVAVRNKSGLKGLDGIILPGGESTTIGKLLRLFDMAEPLKKLILGGLPVYGTCAGLILLAKEIENEPPHLGVMDIAVKRNAYGRQIDSFISRAVIPEFCAEPLELVFIRAPWIERTFGNAEPLAELNGHIIAARQNNMLVTAFHPELTDGEGSAVHRYFVEMCK